MPSKRHTTVVLTKDAQAIKDLWAEVYGLKNMISAGLLLFANLDPMNQRRAIKALESEASMEFVQHVCDEQIGQDEFVNKRKAPVGARDTEGSGSVKDKELAIIVEALGKIQNLSKQADKLLKQAQQGKALSIAQAKKVQAVVKEHEAVLRGRSVPHEKSVHGKSG